MAKISTYPSADVPLLLSDRLIGTEAIRPVPSPTPLATKNFSLAELLQFFQSQITVTTNLQAVLNAGNIATQNINLTGTIDATLIKPVNIEDTSGSQGTVFQVLSKGAVSITWANVPIDNLQAVLNAGNTATQNITLIGDITSTKIIPGNIQDDTSAIGTTGQFLSKTASGIRWVNAPVAITPTLGDVVAVGDTANQDIFINTLRLGRGTGTGANNTALGYLVLGANTTGFANLGVGAFALAGNTTASRNTAVGYAALYTNISGNLNVAVGGFSQYISTTGIANVSLGYGTLQTNVIGNFNTALGYRTLLNNKADKNTAIGAETMFVNQTGTFNTVVGQEALRASVAGSFNSIVGCFAILNAEASYVAALGRDAGRFSSAGNLLIANESIFIGFNSKSLNTSSINEIVIGANAVGLGDNTVVLGSDLITKTALKGDVGIGTTAPSQKLHVDGNLRVTGAIYDSNNSPGTSGQLLSSTATGTLWQSNPGYTYGLFAQTALGNIITPSSGEANLLGTGVGSLSVPANAFKVGDSFTAKICGYLSCANNEDIHIRVDSNGSLIADAGVFRLNIATNKYFELSLDFTVTKIGGLGVAELFTNGQFSYNKNANSNIEGNNFANIDSTMFDTTIVNNLSITAEWVTSNVANKIQSQNAVLTKVY